MNEQNVTHTGIPARVEFDRSFPPGFEKSNAYTATYVRSRAVYAFNAYEADIAQKNARIAALEGQIANWPYDCIWCGETIHENQNHWEDCDQHPARKSIAELEALRPKFDVGDDVEWIRKNGKDAMAGKIMAVRTVFDIKFNDVLTHHSIDSSLVRLPHPEVTKPTADEWYEAWGEAMQVSGDERWSQLYSLAFRHEATKGAGE